jgi:hypothetical protein
MYKYEYPGLNQERVRLQEKRRLAEMNNMRRRGLRQNNFVKYTTNYRYRNSGYRKPRMNTRVQPQPTFSNRNKFLYLLKIYPRVFLVPTKINNKMKIFGKNVIQKSEVIKMLRNMNSRRSWFNKIRTPIPKKIKNNMNRFIYK